MLRLTRWFVSSALAVVTLWPVAAAAQTEPQPMTVDQARNAFTGAGYTVDRANSWDWTRPPVTSFEVHGRNDDRVLMVLVYPSMTDASDARQLADSHEQTFSPGQPLPSGSGPHLVSGFGMSTWSGNVALVQTTETQLERAYQAQADRDNGIVGDTVVADDPSAPSTAVDLDFLQALQNGAVNL
jgi:hypothetical protein